MQIIRFVPVDLLYGTTIIDKEAEFREEPGFDENSDNNQKQHQAIEVDETPHYKS